MKKHARYSLIGTVIISLLGVPCLAATEFVGNITSDQFEVHDGDGLKIKGFHLRLQGIDAFEKSQSCVADGASWPCGQKATEALKTKIKNQTLLCNLDKLDKYGRSLATCSIAIAYKYFKEKETPNAAILYGFVAALYNPIATIHLGKPLWMVVNLLTVFAFAHAYRSVKNKTPALLDAKIADRLDGEKKPISHNNSGENNGVS